MHHERMIPLQTVLSAIAAALVVVQVADAEQPPATVANRVFEIRTYTCEPGKLDQLQSRFRDHTTKLLAKHGITNVGYWTPADEPRSQDTLIYIVAHPSRQAAAANWQRFINDPEWHAARDKSEADGKIVSKIESVYLDPTDYSPIQ